MNEQTPSTPTPESPAPMPISAPTKPASRRSFLLGAGAGAGATALSAVALASGSAAAATRSDAADAADDGPAPDGAVVAYVRDARSGQITLMAHGHEVVVVDHALARTLARKAR